MNSSITSMETEGVQRPFVWKKMSFKILQIKEFGKRTNENLALWLRLLNGRMKFWWEWGEGEDFYTCPKPPPPSSYLQQTLSN